MAELQELLDQAAEALLRGDLAALPHLSVEIERAVDSLPRGACGPRARGWQRLPPLRS